MPAKVLLRVPRAAIRPIVCIFFLSLLVPQFSFAQVTGRRLEPLTPHDHTLILQAIIRNMPAVVRHLNLEGITPENRGERVLRAAIEVPEIPSNVKERIGIVLRVIPALNEAARKESPSDREAVAYVAWRLQPLQTLPDVIRELEQLREAKIAGLSRPALQIGLTTAIRILRDGRETIYNPAYYTEIFGKYEGGAPRPIPFTDIIVGDSIVKEDVKGAVGGALAGAILGGIPGGLAGAGVGAATGAVGGAIEHSAAEAVGKLWDRLWSSSFLPLNRQGKTAPTAPLLTAFEEARYEMPWLPAKAVHDPC